MSRVRTGHGPQDWSDPDDGRPALISGFYSGSLVVGNPTFPHGRRTPRNRKKPVDMNDYHKESRWDGMPRCGVMMKQAKMPCVRTAGHSREHRTSEALEYNRDIRRAAS